MGQGGGVQHLLIRFLWAPGTPRVGCPTALVTGLFFSGCCQQGAGKTFPPSWVQVVRRISGPGLGFLELAGLPSAVDRGAGWRGEWRGGLPHHCLWAGLYSLALVFHLHLQTGLFRNVSPEHRLALWYPVHFTPAKAGSERFPEVPPGQGTFLLQPPRFALGCGFGTLGPPKTLLRTESLPANLFL